MKDPCQWGSCKYHCNTSAVRWELRHLQTWVFNWWKPSGKAYNDLARRIGFAPLLFWGLMGTTLPLQKPMTIVIGKPLRPQAGDQHEQRLSRWVHGLLAYPSPMSHEGPRGPVGIPWVSTVAPPAGRGLSCPVVPRPVVL